MSIVVRPLLISVLSCTVVVLIALLYQLGLTHNSYYYAALSCVLVNLLVIRHLQKDKSIISPAGFFILSVLIFIMARPFISVLFNVELIQVGGRIDEKNITLTICLVSIGLSAFIASFGIRYNFRYLDRILMKYTPRVPALVINLLLMVSFVLLAIFVNESFHVAKLIGSVDYFSVAGNSDFDSHLKWFFLAKQLVLLAVLLSGRGNRDYVFIASILLFVGSIGFIMIGLRGYTISYFFLYLYFLSERRKINFAWLTVIAIFLLYISAYVLEYRLGFSVFNSPFEMVYLPLYQQGATFEVVFGAVNFIDEIRACLPYEDYFEGADFGGCVDEARGVPFEEGGFASSFFAEAYYWGWLFYILVFAIMGSIVSYLDHLSCIRKRSLLSPIINTTSGAKIGVFLLCMIPNLVYFARSGVFDFPTKFIETCAVVVVYSTLASLMSKRRRQF